MQLVLIFFIACLGLVIGSFVNVVIYRTLTGDSPLKGRSYCDKCKHLLAWYDNIPLLSFALLGGKCRYCQKKISLQYPIVEFTTMVLFLWWYLVGFAFFRLTQEPLVYLQPLFWLTVGVLLLIIVATDLLSYLIPDYAVFGLGLLALLYRSYLIKTGIMNPTDLTRALIGSLVLAILFAAIILLTKGKGMGWGDVKLVFVLGLLVGWPRLVVASFSAFFTGAIVSLFLLAVGKKRFGQTIPFGPFLILGAVIALLWGNAIWEWYWNLL